MTIPATPEACRAEQERVLARATDAVNEMLRGKLWLHVKTGGVYLEYGRADTLFDKKAGDSLFSGIMGAPLIEATDDIEGGELFVRYRNVLTGEGWARPARLFDDGRFIPLTLAPAAILAAHTEALSDIEGLAGIEGLAIAWEATAARIRRTEVRPDGVWMDIESAQVHDSLITCARQLRALLPSPPVEELVSPLASPDDDESETDFLVGQRVIVHGTLTHIHDTSDGEDVDEFCGDSGVIVADATDRHYHYLVYVNRTQRVYECVMADLSYPAWGEE